jgi:hypothetical protein
VSISIISFVVMAAASVLFVAAAVISEGSFKLPAMHQTGDSSLHAESVNWLGVIALIGAVLICLVQA